MKTLLIYPAISLCGFGARRPLTGNGEVDWIHHGVGLVASYARSKGFDISVLDMRALNSWDDFDLAIKQIDPDVIGISISYIDYKVSLEAVRRIKAINPYKLIVVGGFTPSLFPDIFLNNPLVDFVVVGEGEIAFTRLLGDIESRDPIYIGKRVEGVKPDLDKLPFIDRSLFDYERETTCFFGPGQHYPHITMIAGRGCPYSCKYCQPAESKVYGKYRIRSVDNVMAELEALKSRYNFKSVTFWDDTFTLDKAWVMEFCDKFEKHYKADLALYCRADIAYNNEDMIERLAGIGTMWMCIGFETGSQRVLDFIGKGVSLEQNFKSAELCRKYGIKVMGTFMLGLPTETPDESWQTIKMIKKLNTEHNVLFYFTPIPSTGLYDYCIENDLIVRSEADMFDISRLNAYNPRIKGIDYDYLDAIKYGLRGMPGMSF